MRGCSFLFVVACALTTTARASAPARVDGPSVAPSETTAPPPQDALRWRWDRPRRIHFQTEVLLPQPMWFLAERNAEQRVVAYQIRTVLRCGEGRRELERVHEVLCRIEDIALSAAGFDYGEERLGPILEEIDERLSAATLQLQVQHDGRVLNVDLEGLDRPRRRVGVMNENLRLIMSRAIAGIDFQVFDLPVGPASVWPQYHTWLMNSTSDRGTAGSTELLHRVYAVLPDGRYVLESTGEGTIVPAGGENRYHTAFASFAVFDPVEGFLSERAWNVRGLPTPSSPAAEGMLGVPYVQVGRMRLLASDEQVDLGETVEVPPPQVPPSALQVRPYLGASL